MTPNEQLLVMRRTRSRRALSELLGLGEGKLWNIERGRRTTEAEAAVIAHAYQLEGYASVPEDTPAPIQPPAPAPEPPLVLDPIPTSEPTVSEAQEAWVRRAVDPPPLPTLDVGTPGRVVGNLRLLPAEPDTEDELLPAVPTPRQMSEVDGLRRISNSEIQTFKRCRRKWWLAWFRDLRLRAESPVGVRQIGDRVHRALREWYVPHRGAGRADPRDALEALIKSDWEALAKLPPAGEITQEAVAAQFQKEADLERVILDGYVQWLTETGVDADYVVIEPEAYLEAPVPGITGVLVIGRLDVRVRRLSDDLRLFMDHKVVGDFTRSTRVLHLDEQVLTYMLLEQLQSDDDDQATAGALYNMLRRSKRTAAARPPFFQRVEVHHNPAELDSFTRRLRGVVGQIEDVRWHLENTSSDPLQLVYPTPTSDCAWQCPFFGVCGMFDDGSRVEAAVNRYYEKTDPTSYYVDTELRETSD